MHDRGESVTSLRPWAATADRGRKGLAATEEVTEEGAIGVTAKDFFLSFRLCTFGGRYWRLFSADAKVVW